MKVTNTKFNGLMIIEPDVFKDGRGYFFEVFNEKEFKRLGINAKFVQDSQSMSNKCVLRGMHFQKSPCSQAKLVRVVSGAVLDIVVDLRKNSKTFGKWFSLELNNENKKMLFIPEGFAHGFLSLKDGTILQYKLTNLYNKDAEGGLRWDDPQVGINWDFKKYGIQKPIISEKDKKNLSLKEILKNI